MKVQDEARWRAQKAEAQREQGDGGKLFCDFVEDWCGLAEQILLRNVPPGVYGDPSIGDTNRTPIEALRDALAPTEALHGGMVPVDWLAQMLVVVCANWAPRPHIQAAGEDPELFDSLTEFEKRIVVEAAGLIQDELQASAEGQAVPDESVRLVYGQQVPTDG